MTLMTSTAPRGDKASSGAWNVSRIRELGFRRLIVTTILFCAVTSASNWSQSLGMPITAPLLYVLGVTVIGATQGLFFGVASAVLAAIIYNFAITDPVFVFRFADIDDFVPLIAFNLCAVISGLLAGRLKDRAAEAQRSARELSGLLDASKAFQAVLTPDDLAATICNLDPIRDGFEVCLLVWRGESLQAVAIPGMPCLDQTTIASVSAAVARGPVATVDGGWLAHSLRSTRQFLGLLLMRDKRREAVRPAPPSLTGIINMIGISLERCLLLERLADAQVLERSEALKTALLSSVSHDMRTPLSAISASASGLLEYEHNLTPEVKIQLLQTIKEQCARLNRYTSDLLNLGRMESGVSPERMPFVDLVDVLGSAINGIRPLLGNRSFTKKLSAEPVFVQADAILLEQVFHNILENAIHYSGDGSVIQTVMESTNDGMKVTIVDEGVGVPPSELERIFDRFYRFEHPGVRVRGSGLGLAIARAFTSAVGGRVYAESPVKNGAGTRIIVILPTAKEGV